MILQLRRYSKRKQAQKAWKAAKDALEVAKACRDTRTIHTAQAALQNATTALLKAETVRVRR